eukprot:IDg9685t1
MPESWKSRLIEHMGLDKDELPDDFPGGDALVAAEQAN